MVDKELAVEVIDLVLKNHSQESIRVQLHRLSLEVETTHLHFLVPRYLGLVIRNAETAFLYAGHAFGRKDFGIDQDNELGVQVPF